MLLNDVKQLDQKAKNSKLSYIVINDTKRSRTNENRVNFLYVEFMSTNPSIVISPNVIY